MDPFPFHLLLVQDKFRWWSRATKNEQLVFMVVKANHVSCIKNALAGISDNVTSVSKFGISHS